MNEITHIYTDGGVIKKNPSSIAGTWAFRYVFPDYRKDYSGVVTPEKIGAEVVTNNQTEMLALLMAISGLPDDWCGVICSDSNVSLGRLFRGWKWNNIPAWMQTSYRINRKRLSRWEDIEYVLIDGHPTKAQLAAGIGKRGNPVSEHNVWCDKACGLAAERFLSGDRSFPNLNELLF